MSTKIGSSNIRDNLDAKLLSLLTSKTTEYTRIWYFGQVIINEDPRNLNRIKVRIPLIDDIFYENVEKTIGDNNLPWCLPVNSRFITTPETNAIVIVLLSDPKAPFFGRVILDTITDLSATDLFERLTPEEQSLSNWLNAENTFGITIPKPIDEKKYNTQKKVTYKVGIRGKGKNKLELNQNNLLLTQNHTDKNKESYLNLSEDSKLETANNIEIVSKKGRNKKYHPVFDSTLFDYLTKVNRMLQKITILLNSVPATSPVGPCTASPSANQLITELNTLSSELRKLKSIGYSEKITIN